MDQKKFCINIPVLPSGELLEVLKIWRDKDAWSPWLRNYDAVIVKEGAHSSGDFQIIAIWEKKKMSSWFSSQNAGHFVTEILSKSKGR